MTQYVSINIGSTHWSYVDNGQGMMPQAVYCPSASDINLQVAADQIENINKILNRAKGTIFKSADGVALKEIQSWEMRRRFSYWKNLDQERVRVKQAVSTAIRALDSAIAAAHLLTEVQEKALKQFLEDHFFTILTNDGVCARMRKDVFDRDVLLGRERGIEARLAPDIVQKRAEKERVMKEHREGGDERALQMRRAALSVACYAVRDAEVCFSKKLGVPLKQIGSGGSGGACTGHALSRKKVTVVKPGDEGPYGVNTPSWMSWIKQFFLSARKCLLWQSEPRAEEGSSRLAEVFEFANTPHTRTEEISARTFHRLSRKECSQQIFIDLGRKDDGTPRVKTLGEYLGVSGQWNSIPRVLRCCMADNLSRRSGGSPRANYPYSNSWWKRVARFLFEKLSCEQKPLPQVDEYLFIMAGLMKYLTGDIDTHFDNMLIATLPDEPFVEGSFLDKYFKGEASEAEIEGFIHRGGDMDHLLCHLFESRVLPSGERIAMINHDGGAAFPHSHPTSWGIDSYLSGRHRFLFETHPIFEKPFPQEVRQKMEGKDQVEVEFLMENALRELIGVIGIDARVYREFRKNPANRLLFKKYIFLGKSNDLEELTRRLLQEKMGDYTLSASHYIYYDKQFRGDLKRIRGMTCVAADQYRFLIHHLATKQDEPMRNLFMHIDQNDFNHKELEGSQRVMAFDQLIKDLAEAQPPALEVISEDCNYDYLRKHVPTLAIRDFIR